MNTEKNQIEHKHEEGKSTNQMRRSLLKMGIAAPVIVTLVNRPAWGQGRDMCSVSGFHSAAAAFNAGVELSGVDNTKHEIPNSPEHYCHPENFPNGSKGHKCSAYTKKSSSSYKKKKSRHEDDSSDRRHDDIDERDEKEGKCFAKSAAGNHADDNETLYDCVNSFNEGSRERKDCLTWFYLNACDGKHYIAKTSDDVKDCTLDDDDLLSFSDYLLLKCGGSNSGGTDVKDTPPPPPTSDSEYDHDGYGKDGYNKDGCNKQGYYRDGFNDKAPNGYDKYGYDRKGYDRKGYDKSGFNKSGFDKSGFNKAGCDSEGYNRAGFKDGYNRAGFNASGCNKEGKDQRGKSCHK
jgi:hypothetical protein